MTPPFLDDLALTREHAFALIARGVADRRSPFHILQVATVGLDGGPRVRSVVLRGFDAPARTLRFHTDARSAKVAEIAREPRVGLHLYDAGAKIQLRIEAVAAVAADGPAVEAAWAATREFSRVCYTVRRGPGEAIDAPAEGQPPTAPGPEDGRPAFRTVTARMTGLEWLFLHHGGHRRAQFLFEGDAVRSRWLVP